MMTKFVEDETDLIPAKAAAPAEAPVAVAVETPAPVAAPVAPVAAVAPPAPTAPTPVQTVEEDDVAPLNSHKKGAARHSDDEDLNVAFGDQKLMSKSDGLDIIRPDSGKTVRFALLTQYVPPKRALNHYIEKKGSFRCLSTETQQGICCEKLGESQPQIVALVLQYTNANEKTGRYEKGADGNLPAIQYEIRFIRLSRAGFRKISQLVEGDEDQKVNPEDIDIIMTHAANNKGYEYAKISSARWKKNPALVAEVAAAVKPFVDGKKLVSKLGKKVTALEMRAQLASVSGDDDKADLADVADIS